MRKKPKLTPSKQEEAEKPGKVLRGTILNYNVSQQIRYENELRALIRQMTTEVKREIIALFKSETAEGFYDQQENAAAMDAASITKKAKTLMDKLASKFQGLFNLAAPPMAKKMVEGATKTSASNLRGSLKKLSGGLMLKTSVIPKGMETVAASIIDENVGLIKTISQQYLADVSGVVMRSITTGNGLADLVPAINKHSGQTYRRAKLIALDQTRKAYNFINKQKLQSLGVKQFEWRHSGGGQKPRRSHIAMSGEVFNFDDLPVINAEQVAGGYESPERGIPGQAINCRCRMIPVVNFSEDE